MTIDKTKLRDSVYKHYQSLINTKISDPKSRNIVWIFSTMPQFDLTFCGFPFIVFDKVIVLKNKDLLRSGFNEGVLVSFTIYSDKESELNTLADSIDIMINANIPREFSLYNYDETSNEVLINSNKTHYRNLTYSFGI